MNTIRNNNKERSNDNVYNENQPFSKLHNYTLVEREKYFPEYEYKESYPDLLSARTRMLEMYHDTVIEGNPDEIEKAEIYERSAVAYFNDGNEISWSIE